MSRKTYYQKTLFATNSNYRVLAAATGKRQVLCHIDLFYFLYQIFLITCYQVQSTTKIHISNLYLNKKENGKLHKRLMLFSQNYVKIVITDIVASKIVWLLIWSLTILIDKNLVLKVNNNTRVFENKLSNLL